MNGEMPLIHGSWVKSCWHGGWVMVTWWSSIEGQMGIKWLETYLLHDGESGQIMVKIYGHDGQPGFKVETARCNRSEWMIMADIREMMMGSGSPCCLNDGEWYFIMAQWWTFLVNTSYVVWWIAMVDQKQKTTVSVNSVPQCGKTFKRLGVNQLLSVKKQDSQCESVSQCESASQCESVFQCANP